jgi:hypothetical protein
VFPGIPDDGQSHECYTPSPEPLTIDELAVKSRTHFRLVFIFLLFNDAVTTEDDHGGRAV